MSDISNLDRQAILNRVYAHFVANKQPAGRLSGANCRYHGIDDSGRRVSCAIGIFDTESRLDQEPLLSLSVLDLESQFPDVLCDVFDVTELSVTDVHFLGAVQSEHDTAVNNAAMLDRYYDFDDYFIKDLAHRLDRFASEQGLVSPCSPRDLGAA